MSVLRIEERAPRSVERHASQEQDWRALAIASAQRLNEAEAQLKDMRKAADELRQRLTKANERREEHQGRANDLQSQVVTLTAERDELRSKLHAYEPMKRRLWELFTECPQ